MKSVLRVLLLAAILAPGAVVVEAASLESARRTAELNPDNTAANFNWGILAMQAKKYGEAAKAMGRVVKLSPKDGEARVLFGDALRRSGKADAAEEQYLQAIKLKTKKSVKLNAYKGLGYARHRQGNIDGALEAFEEAADLDPKDPNLQQNIAKLRSKGGDPKAALKAFKKALKKDSKNTQAAVGICQIQTQLGDFKRAAKDCEACLKMKLSKKEKASASYNLGYAYFRMEKKPQAKKYFGTAVTLDKSLATAHYNLGFLKYEDGKLDEALTHFQDAVAAKKGDYPEAQYNVAVVLGDLSRWDEAAAIYRKLLKKDPKNEDAKINLAYVVDRGTGELLEKGSDAFIKGEFDDAEKAWKSALRLDPKNKDAKKFLAKLPKKPKAKPKVETKKLVSKDKAILDKGLALFDKGDYAGAIMQLKFYVRNHPKDVKAASALAKARGRLRQDVDNYLNQAQGLIGAGKRKEARSVLNKALDLDPENARANALIKNLTGKVSAQKASKEDLQKMYFNGVNAYLDGDLDKAMKAWNKVLKSDPNHLDAQRSLDRAKLEVAALKARQK